MDFPDQTYAIEELIKKLNGQAFDHLFIYRVEMFFDCKHKTWLAIISNCGMKKFLAYRLVFGKKGDSIKARWLYVSMPIQIGWNKGRFNEYTKINKWEYMGEFKYPLLPYTEPQKIEETSTNECRMCRSM